MIAFLDTSLHFNHYYEKNLSTGEVTPAWREEGSIPTLKLYAMGTNKEIAKMKLDDGRKTGDKLKRVGE